VPQAAQRVPETVHDTVAKGNTIATLAEAAVQSQLDRKRAANPNGKVIAGVDAIGLKPSHVILPGLGTDSSPEDR